MGVILVVVAVVVAILLFNAGGGAAKASDPDQTAADAANGKATTTTTIPAVVTTPPSSLEVVVGNASGTPGRAKTTSEKLSPLGYTNIQYKEATTTSPVTVVYYAPGFDADALALAQLMGLTDDRAQAMPAQSPLKEPVPTAALTVLVGSDFDPAIVTFGVPSSAPTN